jgi:hypothetical protein
MVNGTGGYVSVIVNHILCMNFLLCYSLTKRSLMSIKILFPSLKVSPSFC